MSFPTSVDPFKTIPTPTTTRTDASDASNDTLSQRLQQHSNSITAVENYLIGIDKTFITILSYGADPTGIADSTSAIQNAVNAKPGGTIIFFPAGTYKISGTITLSKSGTYLGAGTSSTIITTTSATADLFNIGASGVHIVGMQMTSSVTRTAGYHVNTTAGGFYDSSVRDFQFLNIFNGIHCQDWISPACVKDGSILSGYANGYGIVIEGSTEPLIDNVLFAAPASVAGILVKSSFSALIRNCLFTVSTYGVLINPQAASKFCEAIFITDCIFDQLITYGIYLLSNLSGNHIAAVRVMGTWFATMTTGVVMQTANAGVLGRVQVIGCEITNCTFHGIIVNDSGPTEVQIRDSFICGNGTTSGSGIFLASGASKFSIIGCKIGALTFGSNNTRYGIELGGSNTNCIITNNDLQGNTLGAQGGTPIGTFVNTNNI